MACTRLCFVIELATMSAEEKDLARVAAVILAAGGSARMGQPKQLLTVRGQPMLRCVTETVCASGVGQVVVVVGAAADRVAQAIEGLPVDLVVNRVWRRGLSTSIRAGLSVIQPTMAAAIIVLADQPMLSPAVLRSLVARYAESRAPIVAPYHESKRGNPVLFDRTLFPELQAVDGDQGGRTVVMRHLDAVARLEVDDPATRLDVDTPQDYRKLDRILRHGRQQD